MGFPNPYNKSGAAPPTASSVTATPSGLVTGTNVQSILTELEALHHPEDLAVTTGVTNFPAASAGQWYKVTTAGWLGGAAGVGEYVNIGDMLVCVTTTAAGTKAAVYTPPGQYWVIIPAMSSLPDGYRGIEQAINTSDVVQTWGTYHMADGLWQNINSVPFRVSSLLSKTTVTFGADGQTTLFTVPADRRCVLEKAIIIAAADAGTTTTTIGQVGALTDFLGTQTLSNLDAQYDAVILQPVPNATPVKQKSYAATTIIQIDVGAHAGAAGNIVLLFGRLY